MSSVLHLRARKIRERAAVRAWQYRQRNYSGGSWFRVRRVLADAASAWRISAEDADALEAQGHVPAAAGLELQPPRRLFFVGEQELLQLKSRHEIQVRLSDELLSAGGVALIRHEIR